MLKGICTNVLAVAVAESISTVQPNMPTTTVVIALCNCDMSECVCKILQRPDKLHQSAFMRTVHSTSLKYKQKFKRVR